MKTEPDIFCSICHEVIRTQAIFFDNNQVYLKKNTAVSSQAKTESDEWFPINFQWIPIIHLNQNLNHQSNISSR